MQTQPTVEAEALSTFTLGGRTYATAPDTLALLAQLAREPRQRGLWAVLELGLAGGRVVDLGELGGL